MPSVRRLTAILAADVAGYSRLMGADEEGTYERLKEDVVGPRDEGDVEHDLDHLGIVIAGGMAMTGPVTARIISGTTSNVSAQGPPRVALCWTGVPVF
jgi:hypothetical protein